MLKNYLKIAMRNLARHKGFSMINIASLSIGVLGCLLIGLFVWDELQFDKSVKDHQDIYRVYTERNDNNTVTNAASVPPPFATHLAATYPEVENTARILMSSDKYLVEYGNKQVYEDKGYYVDPSLLTIFSLNLVKGNAASALSNPYSVVISEEMAARFFNNENPIGKTIKIDKEDFAVTGVMDELPHHFHFDLNYMMSMSSAGFPKERMENWGWNQFYTYVKLKSGAEVANLEKKFKSFIKTEIGPKEFQEGSYYIPIFQPLTDIHLKSSDFVYDKAIRGNETYVKGLTIIALFVLIIAGFNFINLATARSFRRAKEIGVRKVVGAERKQLIYQFISETIFLSFIAVVIALIATIIILPYLNEFTGKNISLSTFLRPAFTLMVISGTILIGILAGIYPALVISGFQPIKVLKSIKPMPGSRGSNWLRQGLVVTQFALSALLIISSLIVYRQVKFMNNKDLGFEKEQLVYFQLRGPIPSKIEAFKTELKKSPNIVSVTAGYGLPGDLFAGETITIPQNGINKKLPTNLFLGDHDYVKTLGMKIIAGRDFSEQMGTDSSEAFIINETAARDFGFGSAKNALGKEIHWDKWAPDSLNPVKKGKVIGVVRDFHYKSLHERVTASVIHIYPEIYKAAVKVKTDQIDQSLAHINQVWNQFAPGYPLDYNFMDETYGTMYKNEEKLGSLLWIFTIMAIVVGCMGLFALAAFSAQQRTKEIGIRKVLGADTSSIIALLSKSFLKPVLIAALIAFPLAWWAMNNWLQDFPYRVTISWWIFIIAGAAALIIAFITISFQSIKAATANPVKSLRTE